MSHREKGLHPWIVNGMFGEREELDAAKVPGTATHEKEVTDRAWLDAPTVRDYHASEFFEPKGTVTGRFESAADLGTRLHKLIEANGLDILDHVVIVGGDYVDLEKRVLSFDIETRLGPDMVIVIDDKTYHADYKTSGEHPAVDNEQLRAYSRGIDFDMAAMKRMFMPFEKPRREPKVRDWEQRERKRRRK